MSFVLLLLAVIGYAGFPSEPANGTDIAAALSQDLKADPASPYKYDAPRQEQEYRERDVDLLAASAEAGDSGNLVCGSAFRSSENWPHCVHAQPVDAGADLRVAQRRLARAPPHSWTPRASRA